MQRILTEQIRPGTKLGRRAIALDGRVLLELAQGTGSVDVDEHEGRWAVPEPPELVSGEVRQAVEAEMHVVMNQVATRFPTEARATGRLPVDLGIGFEQLSGSTDRLVDSVLANPGVVFNLQNIRTVDQYTLGHSVNVCVLSTLVGMALGYGTAELRNLAVGALLHDIGKVAIPTSILHKPGRLTPAEFSVMKEHTTIGWRILAAQRGIRDTASLVALQHHESWSGGGYPRGLGGGRIYRHAQVVAVADCFDAMSSDRVYRKAMTPAEAMHVIQNEMPGKFQPEILEAFTHSVAPYPVGSVVEITGGHRAVVTAVERGRTNRPRVRLLHERAEELELAGEPHLSIVRTLRPPLAHHRDVATEGELQASCSAE